MLFLSTEVFLVMELILLLFFQMEPIQQLFRVVKHIVPLEDLPTTLRAQFV
jgi:hypothetical protein